MFQRLFKAPDFSVFLCAISLAHHKDYKRKMALQIIEENRRILGEFQ